ncbi:MAG: PD40 domain-containing protein [Planctomycetes bacterium]|nr:PD40 domain-containing protein [Planctomycetota bacterium]
MRTMLKFGLVFALVASVAGLAFAQGRRAPQPNRSAKPVLDPKMGLPGSRFPSFSPDGKTVVYTLYGDLWSMPANGGRSMRLTLNDAYDTKPLVTPDGKEIVFVSDRSGSYDLWVMPIDGGQPRRLTHHNAGDVPTGFTADGKHVLFTSRRAMGWNRGQTDDVYSVPLNGGTPTRLTFTGANSATTPDNGETLYFVAGASDWKVQEYEGTANDRLYRQETGKAPEELLGYSGNSREPRISADGKRLYFTREVNGSFELFKCDNDAQTCEQITDLGEDGLSNVSYSSDESTIVFVWKFYLWTLDLGKEGAKPKLLKIDIREDTTGDKMVERRFTEGIQRASLSNDGKAIVFALGGDIWVMDANGGEARAVTNDAFLNDNPRLSPDGRSISFYSNRSGNSDIWVIGTNGQGLRQITTNAADDFFQNWSPDGQSVVFCSTRSGNKDIWIKGVDGSPAVQLTTDLESDDDPVFSPDGRQIAFDSGRSGNADIYVMDVDGKNQRRVYGTPAIEEVPTFSPDGRFLAFDRITRGASFFRQDVVVTDINGSGEVLVGEGSYPSYTPDGKEILYVDGDGKLTYAPAPAGINSGRSVPFVAVREVSEKAEMLKAFDEAHTAFGMSFYDPNFHGKDWVALGKKYRALVEACGCREEFLYYLNKMVGEVNASHSGASGSTMKAKPYETGYLGMELVPEVLPGNRLRMRVDSVEKGGPADQVWIREGDYIFRVDRQAVSASENFYEKLEGKVGKNVSLFVADNPNGENFREVTIKPESWMARRQRMYQQFVQGNKLESAKQSRGKVAYVHIASMMPQNLNLFENELASPQVQSAKALIIDVRDNGGGNIHQQLVDILSRRSYAYMQLRNGMRIGQPQVSWNRPIVVLINERSYSDAEVFPHAIKTLGLGTVIGVQTAGAVIGTRDIRLSDGTNWRLPSTGFFNIDGMNQEHNGCIPDITVEITPDDQLNGRDPQLKKAIEVLLDQIKTGGAPSTEQPGTPTTPAKEGEFCEPPVALPMDE